MDMTVAVLLSIVVGYAFGSLPWAHMAARRFQVVIGSVDTGIAGAANVYRNVSHVAGIAVFLGDAGKGAAAVVAAHLIGAHGNVALLALTAAIAGHSYPLMGRLTGGIGLATLVGGAATIGGWIGLAALGIGMAMLLILRNTGNAGGFGFTAYLILGVIFGVPWPTLAGVILLAVAVLVRAHFRHARRQPVLE